MKKLIAGAFALMTLFFVSCHKENDNFDFSSAMNETKKQAAAENKDILLFFSAMDQDPLSERLNNEVFQNDEFIQAYESKFKFLNIDFSNSRFDVFKPEFDEEKDIDKIRKDLENDMKVSALYDVRSSPKLCLITADGYYIAEVLLFDESTVKSVSGQLDMLEAKITEIHNLVEKTNSKSKDECIEAIDALFEDTPDSYKGLLLELNEKVLKLDKKNKTGLAEKHLFAFSDAKSQLAVLNDDFDSAIEALKIPLSYSFVDNEIKQRIYYSIGYFILQTGGEKTEVKKYFKKAVKIAPDTEAAEQIQYGIDMMEAAENDSPVEGPEMAPAVSDEPSEETTVEPAQQ